MVIFMTLKPDMYKKNIYEIDYKKLKKMNIKYLFFDLDNTIMSYQDEEPNEEVKELFNNLKQMDFKCFLFSNSHSKRLMKVKDILNVDVYYSSMKPLKKNYKKILKKYNKETCAFIGDQIMTDVIGAKRNDLFIIFVDRINDKEPIYTKFWRFFEGFILRNYKKRNIFEKGKYYE